MAQRYEYNVTRTVTGSNVLGTQGAANADARLITDMNEMDAYGWELVNGSEHSSSFGYDNSVWSQMTVLFWRRPRSS
jgi:hypothetical protein